MKCPSAFGHARALYHTPANALQCRLQPLLFAFCSVKPPLSSSFHRRSSSSHCTISLNCSTKFPNGGFRRRIPRSSSKYTAEIEPPEEEGDDVSDNDVDPARGVRNLIKDAFSQDNSAIVSACFIGLLTGISVVLFNYAVHELRDFFWDEIPSRGATWLREEPIESKWQRVVAVPVCGGLIVSVLNVIRGNLDGPGDGTFISNVKASAQPILKTVAACVTLGTGNSLGPEGPSVEIGASIAKGVGNLTGRSSQSQRSLSLVAAGSAAGIASGFNAAVAGCFFAVESVLWPSPAESSSSVTNATSMVILSAVIASVVSEIGLGSEPAFSVPQYDFRSPSELPLYLLLGVLCGLVSLTMSRCTSYMLVVVENVHKIVGIPKSIFPVLGGLAVGLIALAYPEILYWGFQNVDILLESRPFVRGLSAELLFQLVAVKIVTTSLCRASGLVGGYYAPSLFIGAATGMSYGKFISSMISQYDPTFHIAFLEVASPQAYGLVGMAATLAGVCQVPLTAVLLLFELTQDYRIVLPLLGAVGLSSWITSGNSSRKSGDPKKLEGQKTRPTSQPEINSQNLDQISSSNGLSGEQSSGENLCELESSLCVDESRDYTELERPMLVSQVMRTKYVTVFLGTLLTETVSLMLAEKQSCAVIVDDDNLLLGLLTLGDIQKFSQSSKARCRRPEELLVSEVYSLNGERSRSLWTATPDMDLLDAKMIMNGRGITHLPVIAEPIEDRRSVPIGILDDECISLAYRVLATREYLSQLPNLN